MMVLSSSSVMETTGDHKTVCDREGATADIGKRESLSSVIFIVLNAPYTNRREAVKSGLALVCHCSQMFWTNEYKTIKCLLPCYTKLMTKL